MGSLRLSRSLVDFVMLYGFLCLFGAETEWTPRGMRLVQESEKPKGNLLLVAQVGVVLGIDGVGRSTYSA